MLDVYVYINSFFSGDWQHGQEVLDWQDVDWYSDWESDSDISEL